MRTDRLLVEESYDSSDRLSAEPAQKRIPESTPSLRQLDAPTELVGREETALAGPGQAHSQRAQARDEIPFIKGGASIMSNWIPFVLPHTQIAIPGFDREPAQELLCEVAMTY